jgi:phosphoribosyl-ATP pyrophosphohydrolase
VSDFDAVFRRLAGVIESRRGGDPSTSWSAKLLANPTLAAKKLAEEAVEVAIAAAQGDRQAVIAESADLVYHWLALLAASEVSLDEVAAALEAREGRSGVAEKASRPGQASAAD